jgi:hypothetical protein
MELEYHLKNNIQYNNKKNQLCKNTKNMKNMKLEEEKVVKDVHLKYNIK